MSRPGIDLLAAPAGAEDLVLLAHGGVVKSLEDAHDWRGALLRMWPFAAAARDAAPAAAVGLVRYRYRGWNGTEAHPAADLRAILAGLPDRIRRVVLIGHSMGGRAVLAAGNDPRVVGILGLAPWLPPGEAVRLSGSVRSGGRTAPIVVLAHGSGDRITEPRLTAAYAGRLRAAGVPVGLLTVEGETHALLRRYADWNELVRRFTLHAVTSAVPSAGAPAVAPAEAPAEAPAVAHAEGCAGLLSTEPDRVDQLPRWNRPAGTAAAVRDITNARLRLHVGGSL